MVGYSHYFCQCKHAEHQGRGCGNGISAGEAGKVPAMKACGQCTRRHGVPQYGGEPGRTAEPGEEPVLPTPTPPLS